MTKYGAHENVNMTISRGVEVKELEIANINLDRNTNSCSGSLTAGGSTRAESTRADRPPAAAAAPPPATPPTLDSSNSYIQVVVQQRGAGAGGAPRVPRSSSPLRQLYRLNAASANGDAIVAGGAGAETLVLVPASLVLPAHATHAAPPHRDGGGGGEGTLGDVYARAAPDAGAGAAGDAQAPLKTQKSWRLLNNINGEKFDFVDNGPERVEVYYFEQGGAAAYLATSEAGRVTACERWARAGARASTAVFAPLPAAAALLLAPPIALLITLERCALMAVRDLVTGVVQTASDYALKPALALTFNAVLQPPLVFAANVARALRSALGPLALAAADALEPAARLLRALRLVTVHVDRTPDRSDDV